MTKDICKEINILNDRIKYLEDALFTNGGALAVAAKWPRWHFNRNYLEFHAIRAAQALIYGKPDSQDTIFKAGIVKSEGSRAISNSPLKNMDIDDVRAYPRDLS
jgi:hypothetical protein